MIPVAEMAPAMRLRVELLTRGVSSRQLGECIAHDHPELARDESTISAYLLERRRMPEPWLRAAAELLGLDPCTEFGLEPLPAEANDRDTDVRELRS